MTATPVLVADSFFRAFGRNRTFRSLPARWQERVREQATTIVLDSEWGKLDADEQATIRASRTDASAFCERVVQRAIVEVCPREVTA